MDSHVDIPIYILCYMDSFLILITLSPWIISKGLNTPIEETKAVLKHSGVNSCWWAKAVQFQTHNVVGRNDRGGLECAYGGG